MIVTLIHSKTSGNWRFSERGNFTRPIIAGAHRDLPLKRPRWHKYGLDHRWLSPRRSITVLLDFPLIEEKIHISALQLYLALYCWCQPAKGRKTGKAEEEEEGRGGGLDWRGRARRWKSGECVIHFAIEIIAKVFDHDRCELIARLFLDFL